MGEEQGSRSGNRVPHRDPCRAEPGRVSRDEVPQKLKAFLNLENEHSIERITHPGHSIAFAFLTL